MGLGAIGVALPGVVAVGIPVGVPGATAGGVIGSPDGGKAAPGSFEPSQATSANASSQSTDLMRPLLCRVRVRGRVVTQPCTSHAHFASPSIVDLDTHL